MKSSNISLPIGAGYVAPVGVLQKMEAIASSVIEGVLVIAGELLFYAFYLGSVFALAALLYSDPTPTYLVAAKWIAIVAIVIALFKSIEWHEGFGNETENVT